MTAAFQEMQQQLDAREADEPMARIDSESARQTAEDALQLRRDQAWPCLPRVWNATLRLGSPRLALDATTWSSSAAGDALQRVAMPRKAAPVTTPYTRWPTRLIRLEDSKAIAIIGPIPIHVGIISSAPRIHHTNP